MWGAIVGDIVGSMYEWHRIKTTDFELFGSECDFTDDSVCTSAVAQILLDNRPAVATLQHWCRRHPHRGYGGFFGRWIHRTNPEPYGSFGNGAAMRVSPAAYLNGDRRLEDALEAANRVTRITHDHPEGLKGALATTHAIWLAFRDRPASEIRRAIVDEYGYDLSRTVDEIRPTYGFDETCQGTVPEAITCALESTSFEDAVRKAVSLGGDSDTLAAIAGPIAEAMYGIPEEFIATARDVYLASAPDIVEVIERMYRSTATRT